MPPSQPSTLAREFPTTLSLRAMTAAKSTPTGPALTPKSRGAPREVGGIGAGDQGLGRRAAGVDAGAADELALDQRDLLPGGGEAAGHRRPGLAGADHDGVEAAVHRDTSTMIRPRTIAPASSMNAAGGSRPNAFAMRARTSAPP